MCPKGHKAKKVEIQVQTTELEFEGGEGEGTNSTHSGKKGRSAPKELNANKGPCPSSCCHTQQKQKNALVKGITFKAKGLKDIP